MLRNARCPGVSNQSSLGDTISQSSFSTHNYDPNVTLYARIRTSRKGGKQWRAPFCDDRSSLGVRPEPALGDQA